MKIVVLSSAEDIPSPPPKKLYCSPVSIHRRLRYPLFLVFVLLNLPSPSLPNVSGLFTEVYDIDGVPLSFSLGTKKFVVVELKNLTEYAELYLMYFAYMLAQI